MLTKVTSPKTSSFLLRNVGPHKHVAAPGARPGIAPAKTPLGSN